MKCTPKKITFRLHQSRFVDVTISEEDGYDMPETIKDCINLEHSIMNSPEFYVDEMGYSAEWITDEDDVQDLEFHEE